ncbi:MAG: gliding motility-associated C-terminal domain-containing protein [Saprospiraceae bacterium]
MNKRLFFLFFFPVFLSCTNMLAQGRFFTQDTIILRLNNCNGNFDICFAGINSGSSPSLGVVVDGVKLNRPYSGCGTDTVALYSVQNMDAAFGPYRLDSLTIGTKKYSNIIFADAIVLTDSLNKWDPVAKWAYDSQFKNIIGKPKLKYSALHYSTVSTSLSNKLGLNTAFVPKGLKLRFTKGSHKVVVSDGVPLVKDSVIIIVGCSQRNYVTKSLKVGETIKHCNDLTQLPGKRILSNVALSALIKINAEFSKVKGDSCIEIRGLKVGKDTFTYVLRGRGGIDDTTTIYVNVSSNEGVGGKHVVNQSVKVGNSINYCINTDALLPKPTDQIVDVVNYCIGSSGKIASVTFGNKEKCLKIDGVKAGRDSVCIVITSSENKSDTTIIYILVTEDCRELIKESRIVVQITDCKEKGEICIPDFRIVDTSRYTFLANGAIYQGFINPCNRQEIAGISYQNLYDEKTGKILPFPFTVQSWGVNGTTFPPLGESGIVVRSLSEIVDVLNKWNPEGKWKLDTLNRFFSGGDTKNSYNNLYIVNNVGFSEHYALFSSSTTFNGISFRFDKGVHTFAIVDKANGCRDDVSVLVSCASNKVIAKDIFVGKVDSICIDLTTLPGTKINISNKPKAGKNADFAPSADKKCIIYQGKKPGKDTLVVVACDENNICDTTTLIVSVRAGVSSRIVFDTILTQATKIFCIDTSFAGGKISSVANTSNQAGTSVNFLVDTNKYCVQYTGTNTSGTDTARIIICDVNNFCDTTTFYITVKNRKPAIFELRDTIPLFNTRTFCLPKDKFGINLSTPISVKNICEKAGAQKVSFVIQPNVNCIGPNFFVYAVTYTGKAIGIDTACIEVTNSLGKKDTIRLIVTVTPRESHALKDTIETTDKGLLLCLDFKQSNLLAAVDTAYNNCPALSGSHANIQVVRSATCKSGWAIRYDGIAAGTDAACVVLRDKLGNADTVSVEIKVNQKVYPTITLRDTILSFQTKSFCLDTSNLQLKGKIDSIWNTCPVSSGNEVVFSIDKNKGCTTASGAKGIAVVYTGAERGRDTACYVIRDSKGGIYNVTFIVTVKPPSPSVLSDILEEGKKLILCPDTTQLVGKIVSVINICPAKSGVHAKFSINPQTNCVEIEGLKTGRDSACIVVCSEFNVCDTTYLYIQVVPPVNPVILIAIDDADSTIYAQAVIIPVVKNDIFNKSDSAKIVLQIVNGKGPKHGVVFVNAGNRVITYIPDPNFKFCGVDTFEYYIAIGQKTDTAKVFVRIKCPPDNKGPFKVHNAFSPNGDGINDVFNITGLDNFTENEVVVYNRWGNQVFSKKNYDNSWDGTWEGNPLPDGTYYYVVSLKEANSTKLEAGYLELRR